MSMIDLNIKILKNKINLLNDCLSSCLYTKGIQHINNMIGCSPSLINSFYPKNPFNVTSTCLKNKLSILMTFSLNSFLSINFLFLSFIGDFFTETFDSHFMEYKLLNLLNVLIIKISWLK